jgi:hypothetical protein
MLTTPAFLPVASPLPSALPLEELIAEIAADAAVALARALREFQTEELSSETREHWSDLIAWLFELRLVYAGQIDFYAVARTRGARLLQERHGKDINARTIAVLIDAVIEVLQQVVRAELN